LKLQRIILLFGLILAVGITSVYFAFEKTPVMRLSAIEVNDVVHQLSASWDNLGANNYQLPQGETQLEYVILDKNEEFVAATRRDLNETIHTAITHRDTIVEIKKGDEVLGKVIFFNETEKSVKQLQDKLFRTLVLIFVALVIACAGFIFYIQHNILQPFQKMEHLAQRIASGNLVVPLEMDRKNYFGAFTESFDLLREELEKARENERKANQSKKELVASLSHDIKTPVASIKAISELMQVKSKDIQEKEQLTIIEMKADQINQLITNIFQATLEELQELKVSPVEIGSDQVHALIHNADYQQSATIEPFSACIIQADPMRLQQVFDNVVSNSYKYADTKLNISSTVKNHLFVIEIRDYGNGVGADEVVLLTNKFYQGKNATGKSGAGLGLYISKYLMNQMHGDLTCENLTDGFAVRISLSLAY
jgi:signal transduction histidine kinase